LPARYVGRSGFVSGADLVDYILTNGASHRTSSGGRPARLLDDIPPAC
jgi:hypothetical protein